MKSKILFSVLFSFAMVLILATPVVAKPVKYALIPYTGANGAEGAELTSQCSAAIAVTRTNDLKVTVVLKGVLPNAKYLVSVWDASASQWCSPSWELNTDNKGNFRGSGTTNTLTVYADGTTASLQVYITRLGSLKLWWETAHDVVF